MNEQPLKDLAKTRKKGLMQQLIPAISEVSA